MIHARDMACTWLSRLWPCDKHLLSRNKQSVHLWHRRCNTDDIEGVIQTTSKMQCRRLITCCYAFDSPSTASGADVFIVTSSFIESAYPNLYTSARISAILRCRLLPFRFRNNFWVRRDIFARLVKCCGGRYVITADCIDGVVCGGRRKYELCITWRPTLCIHVYNNRTLRAIDFKNNSTQFKDGITLDTCQLLNMQRNCGYLLLTFCRL